MKLSLLLLVFLFSMTLSYAKQDTVLVIETENFKLIMFEKTAAMTLYGITTELQCYGMRKNQVYLTNGDIRWIVKFNIINNKRTVTLINDRTNEELIFIVK